MEVGFNSNSMLELDEELIVITRQASQPLPSAENKRDRNDDEEGYERARLICLKN